MENQHFLGSPCSIEQSGWPRLLQLLQRFWDRNPNDFGLEGIYIYISGQTPLLWGVAERQTTKRQGEIGPARTLNLSFRPCFSMEPSVYLMTLGTCDFRTWKMSRTHIIKPLEQAPVPRGGDMKCTWSNMQTTSKRPSICVESFAPWDWERCYKSLIAQFSQPQAHALFPYKALETLIAWWPIVALCSFTCFWHHNSTKFSIWIKIWASLPKHSAPCRTVLSRWMLGPCKRATQWKSRSHKHLNLWSCIKQHESHESPQLIAMSSCWEVALLLSGGGKDKRNLPRIGRQLRCSMYQSQPNFKETFQKNNHLHYWIYWITGSSFWI